MRKRLSRIRRSMRGDHRFPSSPSGAVSPRLPWKVLIGTHHKTGTKWLGSVFRAVCIRFDLEFVSCHAEDLPDNWDVFLQDHSRFGSVTGGAEFRGVHIIRDPRDVAVSGSFYHMKSDEEWLYLPREDMGGRSYHQVTNSFEDHDDRLLFEMENATSWVVRDMLAWDRKDSRFMEIRYEDLITDHDLLLFHRMFVHLGFPGWTMPALLNAAYRNSLFSGKIQGRKHIRSGKARQWEKHFRKIHRERFFELYGEALIELGYEDDDSWVRSGE